MVVLREYDANWTVLFEEEAHRLRAALGSSALRIEHVGSTSVPGLAAKPILDLIGRTPSGLLYLYQGACNGGFAGFGYVFNSGWNIFDNVF